MRKPTDLTDVTFLIPTRLDSIDRLINLQAVIRFLQESFITNIHILEADSYSSKLIDTIIPRGVKITFVKDNDPVFFRTFYINKMVKECKTPILSVWDTDVIAPPEQIIKCIKHLSSGSADFTYPYKKKFLDTSRIIRELFLETNDWKVLDKHQNKMKQMYVPNPVGGAFFANKETYIESGIENMNFYGWGIEDGERINRWIGLGYKFKQVQGNLYHLTHARGLNSTFQSNTQRALKRTELERIRNLTEQELRKEIEGWNKDY